MESKAIADRERAGTPTVPVVRAAVLRRRLAGTPSDARQRRLWRRARHAARMEALLAAAD